MRSKIRYGILFFNALVSILLCAVTLLWGTVFYFTFIKDILHILSGLYSFVLLLLIGLAFVSMTVGSFLNLNKSFRFVMMEGRMVRVHYSFSRINDYTLNLRDMDGYCIQRYQKDGPFLRPLKRGSTRVFLKRKNDIYFLVDSLYVRNFHEMLLALNALNLQESEPDVVLDKKEWRRAWRGEKITITGEENDAVILESERDNDSEILINGTFGFLASVGKKSGDENIESEVDIDGDNSIDGDFDLNID